MTLEQEAEIRLRFRVFQARYPRDHRHWTMAFLWTGINNVGYFDPGIGEEVIRFRDYQEAMDMLEMMELFL